MPSRTAAAFALALALAAVAEAGPTRTDHDKTVDFSSYSTYVWGRTSTTPGVQVKDLVAAAVDRELAARGLDRAEGAKADLRVHAHAAIEGQAWEPVDDFGYGELGWEGWRNWGPTTVNLRRVPEGTLFVDMVDTATGAIVWRGVADDLFSKMPKKVDKLERKITKAVAELFESYPPG